MRISDWSSDVCSSDLLFLEEGDGGLLLAPAAAPLGAKADLLGERATLLGIAGCDDRITLRQVPLGAILVGRHAVISCEMAPQHLQDRKSVESGKSVSVRVDIGGRRSIKKKNKYAANPQPD